MQNSKKGETYIHVQKISNVNNGKQRKQKPYAFAIDRIMPSAYSMEERRKLKEFEKQILGISGE